MLADWQQHSLFAAEKEAMTDEYNKLERKYTELQGDYDTLQRTLDRAVTLASCPCTSHYIS